MVTTIQLKEKTKQKLEHFKVSPRETYEEVIEKLIDLAEEDHLELSDKTKAEIAIARKEMKEGKTIPHSQLKRSLGL